MAPGTWIGSRAQAARSSSVEFTQISPWLKLDQKLLSFDRTQYSAAHMRLMSGKIAMQPPL